MESGASQICISLIGLVVLNTRVAYNGAVWGEDFVLADIPLIQKVSGRVEPKQCRG